ncbi:MAG: ABC transporter permease [Deltaproteobacteria bacterium]|nr:ABC transporter permease [Deltaproteobacteria bacterium]
MTEEAGTKDRGAAPIGRAREVLLAILGGISLALRPVGAFAEAVGEHLMLLGKCVYWAFRPPFRLRLLVEAAEFIGVGSLPIITLVGTFTGAVTALQSVSQLRVLGAEGFAGSATGLALSTELGPVLTGLMLAGRAGAGIATELGTMRITEQIDALETMAVSPIQYLVVPRIIAATIMTPILMVVFFTVGMAGGYMVGVKTLGVDHGLFVENFRFSVDPSHLAQGFIKSTVFGLAFSLIGCYQGYNAWGGGRGVGLATTKAVVVGSVSILILDYFLTDILLSLMPAAA